MKLKEYQYMIYVKLRSVNLPATVTKKKKSHCYRIGKGKATPLQAFTGPEGSRRLRLPDFKTIGK
jgi:hypothetical protein